MRLPQQPKKGAIVCFNIDRVASEYDMANDLRSVVESRRRASRKK